MTELQSIAVLGSGAWGTAIAHMLAQKGHQTALWGRSEHRSFEINQHHTNKDYLPGITLSGEIAATTDLAAALREVQIVMLVVPAQAVGQMVDELKPLIRDDVTLVLCAKGIDRKTGKLPAETALEALPNNLVACLSGPSFAADVAQNLPTAVTLACENLAVATQLSQQLSSPAFRVYASSDLKGVELGGALKNVIAVAVGVCRGMGLGASAEAALIARGFAEVNRLAIHLGARAETLTGLSGLGDLVLTCSSTQSRNFSYGMAIGRGQSTTGLALAEGAFTGGVALKIARDNAIECPVIEAVANLVDGKLTAKQAVGNLLARPLKTESD
jgi:glycerol-3-phosphate dehydrogenase (NAD(P)+)